ncbi:MAG: 3-deoxy-8-phosphooctulonate synthase [Pseudomonadota bacterium]
MSSIAPKSVAVGPHAVANDRPVVFILGPSQIESRDHARECAAALKQICGEVGAPFIFKSSFDKANRSSHAAARGVGAAQGLPILAEIGAEFAPTTTDVHLPEHCAPAAEAVDLLQIPAFLCRQTDLLNAAAATGKPINIKKGQFLAPWDMKAVASKLEAAGAVGVMLCERGASFGYNTLVSDMRSLPTMAETGWPVVFDATHSVQQPGGLGDRSGGDRRFAPVLARAAAAVGVAALFIACHPDPDAAPSDGPNMIPMRDMPALLRSLLAFDRLAKQGQAA